MATAEHLVVKRRLLVPPAKVGKHLERLILAVIALDVQLPRANAIGHGFDGPQVLSEPNAAVAGEAHECYGCVLEPDAALLAPLGKRSGEWLQRPHQVLGDVHATSR